MIEQLHLPERPSETDIHVAAKNTLLKLREIRDDKEREESRNIIIAFVTDLSNDIEAHDVNGTPISSAYPGWESDDFKKLLSYLKSHNN